MSAISNCKRNSCIFQWEIKNIGHCWLKETQHIASHAFVVDVLESTKWSLWLYPKGNSEINKDYIGVFLKREDDSDGPNDIEVQFQLACLGKDGTLLEKRTPSPLLFNKSTSMGFRKFEERKFIFITNKENFLSDDTLTLQCTIWKGNEPVEPKNFYSRTVFEVNRRSFVWRIDDFSAQKSGFRNEFKDGSIKFDLSLNEGLDFEKKLLMNISSCNKNMKYFLFKLSIIDSESKKEDCGTHEYFLDDLKKEVVSTVLFTKKVLDDKDRYLPNEVLSLECEYVYSDGSVLYEYCVCGKIIPQLKNEIVERPTDVMNKRENYIGTSVLVNDLMIMYNDSICSDTALRTSTQTFQAHKGILSARSPVFRSMFTTDMKEKNSGHVDITDFEDDTVRRMLLYIYTDSLEDLNFESAYKLYVAADKYQILTLRNGCSSFLKENLCQKRACDVLVLSDLHHDDELKAAAVNYILGQRKKIFCSQEWKDFMTSNIKLAADVMYQKIYRD